MSTPESFVGIGTDKPRDNSPTHSAVGLIVSTPTPNAAAPDLVQHLRSVAHWCLIEGAGDDATHRALVAAAARIAELELVKDELIRERENARRLTGAVFNMMPKGHPARDLIQRRTGPWLAGEFGSRDHALGDEAALAQQVPADLPPLVGTLASLSPHQQSVIRAYGAACARVGAQQVPEPQADGVVKALRPIIDKFPELNPSNYDHDDACALNAWGVELVLAWAAAHVADAAPVAQQVPAVPAREVARQVFALCEATEDVPASAADSFGLERFKAGQRFEAKRIRRTIGDWLTTEEHLRAAPLPTPEKP